MKLYPRGISFRVFLRAQKALNLGPGAAVGGMRIEINTGHKGRVFVTYKCKTKRVTRWTLPPDQICAFVMLILFATWKSFTFSDSESLNRCKRRKYLLTSSADRHSIYFVKVQRTHLLDLSGKCFAILWNLRWAGSKFKTKIYSNSRLLRPSTFQMSWETKLWLFKYSWRKKNNFPRHIFMHIIC